MNLINATILGQAISFILFVWFCLKYIWPPLIMIIEKRQKEIADGLNFAKQAKKDLDLARFKVAEQINQAQSEAKIIIEQANKHRDHILATAKTEADLERTKIITLAHNEIYSERKRVCEELRKQVVIIAITIAEKIIERSIDNTTINNDFIDKLVKELYEDKLNV